MFKLSSVVIVFLKLLTTLHAASILGVFPTSSISHQVVFHSLMKELASRGHHLTILTTDVIKPLINHPNVTQIDLHFSYESFRRECNFVEFNKLDNNESELMNFFFPIMMKILEEQLSHPDVKKLIVESEKYHFDAVIIEHLMYTPIIAFGEIYKCPVIGITSLDAPRVNHLIIGNEANPIAQPDLAFPFVNKRLTFFERWRILKYFLNEKLSQETKFNKFFQNILDKHFSNVTLKVEELPSRVDFLMTNAHPAMGFIRPITPKTIQLGFMHIEPPKELVDLKLKKFLDESKNGVIYMSFGSNVQSTDLDSSTQQIFIKVFSKMNYNFIWKFENDNLPNQPSNLLISKWLPQADLLAHKNIKLFITQGGQQSMEEAIDREVPMIVIPFLGDQETNANRIVQRKIGIHLDLKTLSEEKLTKFINEMLKPEYKENVRRLKTLVHDQPMSSREKAAWWTEYVIRHKGTKHLEYSAKDFSLIELYFLDFAALAVIFLIIFTKLVSSAYLVLFSKSSSDKKLKKK